MLSAVCLTWDQRQEESHSVSCSSAAVLDMAQVCECCGLSHFIRVRFCGTLWTVACQAPLSMGFSSRGSSQPRNQTRVSSVSCIGRWVLDHEHHLGSPKCVSDAPLTSACYEMRHVSMVTCPDDSSVKSNVLTT
ncbi:hypothetical protein JEQ12_007114 [Ovis aries]|uniref:Uncharacterized protein n=1 Tax=Ovis aries TaxID=9940 RepID=A0A836CUY8_SHEEP|nr:hypothetical protein JEQ12_007114 [Ovis aries]